MLRALRGEKLFPSNQIGLRALAPFVVKSSFDNDLSRASICGHNDSRFMADKPGFMQYLTAAFNARPFGMFVAPNWMGLAAFGLLGIINPGFWVLGAGLEIGYLLALATNVALSPHRRRAPAVRRGTRLDDAHRAGAG